MLGYVFWHSRTTDTPADRYLTLLLEFHRQLGRLGLPGFHGSFVFRTPAVPWLASPVEVYEEWYLLDGSAGLDVLNWAAVAPPCRDAHDAVARSAAVGTGGLYRGWAAGEPMEQARLAFWTDKPAGASYPAFLDMVRAVTDRQGAWLWGRQMTLGPTPEFCLQVSEEAELPEGLRELRVELERVWPSP